MKYLFTALLFFAFLFPSADLKAQGNLQFNQVVLITENVPYTSPYISSTYTVPTGKVWKIEAAGCPTTSLELYEVNGVKVNMGLMTGGSFNEGENLPIWFPAGTTFKMYEPSSSGGFFLSIIEFNVVSN